MNVRRLKSGDACEVTEGCKRLMVKLHRGGQLEISTSLDDRVGMTQFLDFADARMLKEALICLLDP
jgi:hypothetical protein